MLPPDGFSPEQAAIAFYACHNFVHAAAAYGIGVLAAHVGARRLLGVGYLLFGSMAFGFMVAPAHPSIPVLVLLFALAGLSMSVEEVLEGTVAAQLLPDTLRGTGYGALAAVNGVGDFIASAAVGLLWANVSPSAGFLYAATTSVVGAVAMLRLR
jgi:MFS family permease